MSNNAQYSAVWLVGIYECTIYRTVSEAELKKISSFVSYSGQSGKSYYAVVTFRAAKDGGGDTKSYATAEVTAK